MAENKSPTLRAMLAEGYDGPTTIYCGRKTGSAAKLALLNFLNAANEKLDDHREEFVPVVGWAIKIASFQQDNGPDRIGLLIGLETEDGQFLQTTSKTIADTLDSFRDIIGEPPYANPLWVQIKSILTRKKRKTDQLLAVEPNSIAPDAKCFGGVNPNVRSIGNKK